MNRTFRKYHRLLATIICFPLAVTVLTGMLATFIQQWRLNIGVTSSVILRIHTGEIFHLGGIYPLLNGLGVIGLLVTGISMTGLFKQRKKSST